MAWLTGWSKRIEITVSNTNIDSDLTHFPLTLKLGTSVGTNDADVSAVFDELTSDSNRKKIAVTKSDGETQIYVEIEKWDDANETAWLWVSKSDLTLSSSGTTTLYLYYDSSHADNTTYVADAGSRTEVWDSNFKGVWHMNSADNSQLKDSTGNHDSSSNSLDTTTGQIGLGMDGNGSEYAVISDHADFDFGSGDFTLEGMFKTTTTGFAHFISKRYSNPGYYLTIVGSSLDGFNGEVKFLLADSTPNYVEAFSTGTVDDGNWHYIVGLRDGQTGRVYIDGSPDGTATNASIGSTDNNWNIDFHARPSNNDQNLTGQSDEIRISAGKRSAAWIKATYHSNTDNLVSWGSEEVASSDLSINVSDQANLTESTGKTLVNNVNKTVANKKTVKIF
jgi:hypothetical protein